MINLSVSVAVHVRNFKTVCIGRHFFRAIPTYRRTNNTDSIVMTLVQLRKLKKVTIIIILLTIVLMKYNMQHSVM